MSRDRISIEGFVVGSFSLSTVDDGSAISGNACYDGTCVTVERERAAVGMLFKHFRNDKLLGTLSWGWKEKVRNNKEAGFSRRRKIGSRLTYQDNSILAADTNHSSDVHAKKKESVLECLFNARVVCINLNLLLF
jgi:hypothetical protein